ncbi:hypothetical protein FM036_33015 [Nostoc sp. HG1]|nr:hypothetical protein [Nostoc sp. HG1]
MRQLTIFLLAFIPTFLINFSATAQQQQEPIYENEKCTQRGISPICDDELDHPTDDNGNFTTESALQLIKSGVSTAKDLYEIGAITLQQKQQLELEVMPERL